MIIIQTKQIPFICYKLVFTIILIHFISFLSLSYSNPSQEYGFIKSEKILIADSLLKIELYDQAALFYDIGLKEYESLAQWEGVIYALNKLGFIKTRDRSFDEGIEFLKKAGDYLEEHIPPNNILVADNYMYKGINYDRSGNFDSALFYHEKAVKIKKELYGDKSENLAESLYFQAQLFSENSRLTMAENLCRKSMEMYEDYRPPDDIIFGRLFSTLSSILRKKYDYDNAVMYSEKSIRIIEKSKPYKVNSLITAYIILANIQNSFLKFDLANKNYFIAEKLFKNDPHAEKDLLYYVYQNQASLYNHVKNPDNALEIIGKIRKMLVEDEIIDPNYEAFLELLSGQAYNLKEKYPLAINMVTSSRQIFLDEFGENYEYVTISNETLGEIYTNKGNFDSALFFLQKALVSLLPEFNSQRIYDNPKELGKSDALRLYDIMYKKADAFREYYFQSNNKDYLIHALEIYKLIDDLNDASRNSKMAEGSLLVINEYFKEEYDKGIDCAYLLYSITGEEKFISTAFSLIEKSKYMLLLKSLTIAEIYQDYNLPIDIKNHEDSLKSQYTSFQVRSDKEKASDTINQSYIEELRSEKFTYERALDEFRLNIQEDYPKYAQIKYDSITVTYSDFKKFCEQENRLGLEYYWGEKAVYLITTDNNYIIYKIGRTEDLDSALNTVLNNLKNGINMSTSRKDFISYRNSAYTVYKNLLEDILKNSKFKNILIIPDGPLSQLPFEALLTQEVNLEFVDYRNLPYLLLSHESGYIYSANLMLNKNPEPTGGKNELLAFSYSSIEAPSKKTDRSDKQDELPHTALELNSIKNIMGGKNNRYYYDSEATESQFKKEASAYQIIHLAVHGESDTSSSINSKLIFKDLIDTEEDGILYMHELFGLDLSKVDLAVLSACETGIGKQMSGEGVFSMARSFAYSGCPSIVMSLWRVDDKYTSGLMSNFYKNLKRGKVISTSLRASKLDFLDAANENTAHPSNWAAFVSIGKDPVLMQKSNLIYYFLTIVIVVSALLIFIRMKK